MRGEALRRRRGRAAAVHCAYPPARAGARAQAMRLPARRAAALAAAACGAGGAGVGYSHYLLQQRLDDEGAAAGELPGAVQALASRGVLQAAARSARTLATAACVSADYKWSLAGVEEGSEKYLAARLGCHERSAKVKRDGSKRRGKSKSCGWLRASSASRPGSA